MRAIVLGALLAVTFLTLGAVAAWAEAGSTLCVKAGANGKVVGPTTPGGTTCKPGYNPVNLPPAGEIEALNKLLPHIAYEAAGVGGQPTIRFSGVNVQIVDGEGRTAWANGEGNLVIGYDENNGLHEQTGSHNLVLGEQQEFTSFGGIDAGYENSIDSKFASVTGGKENYAEGEYSSVSGGLTNVAGGRYSSVSGGSLQEATGEYASMTGGRHNAATGRGSSVSGGENNTTDGPLAWIGSGFSNRSSGRAAAIFGGSWLTASNEYEALP